MAEVRCAWCWREAPVTLVVEALGFFRGHTFYPGEELRLCHEHARQLDQDLRRAERWLGG